MARGLRPARRAVTAIFACLHAALGLGHWFPLQVAAAGVIVPGLFFAIAAKALEPHPQPAEEDRL